MLPYKHPRKSGYNVLSQQGVSILNFDNEPLYRCYPNLTGEAQKQDLFVGGLRFWEYLIADVGSVDLTVHQIC